MTGMGRRRRIAEPARCGAERQRPEAVDRLAHGIDDAPEPSRATAAPRHWVATTALQPRRTPSSGPNGISSALAPENPTTSQGIDPVLGLDRHPSADRHGMDRPGDLHHQAAHADDPAVDFDRVDLLGRSARRALSWPSTRLARGMATEVSPLTSCLPASLIITSPSWDRRLAARRQARLAARIGYPNAGSSSDARTTDVSKKPHSLQDFRTIRWLLPSKSLRGGIRFC